MAGTTHGGVAAWVAAALIILGAILAGVAVIRFSLWLGIAAAVVGLVGVVLAIRANIMESAY